MTKRSKKRGRFADFFTTEKIIITITLFLIGTATFFFVKDIKTYDYIVETNAFFAPFEFYDNRKIVGVDVEIINKVAERLDASIDIKNVEFDMIIDNVASGIIADAGAAGLTITPARAEKVNFSIPYYTSVQYVIFNPVNAPTIKTWEASTAGNNTGEQNNINPEDNTAFTANNNQPKQYITWNALSGKIIGSQMGSTGYLFASDETKNGVLKETNTTVKGLDSHQLSADAIKSHIIDYAIADELAAQFIIEKNPELKALPLYYASPNGDYPTEESYAIAVNKQRPELLSAFNDVLTEMQKPDENGQTEIDKLILKYMKLSEQTTNNKKETN